MVSASLFPFAVLVQCRTHAERLTIFGGDQLLARSPSTMRNTPFGGDILESGISVNRPTGWSLALHQLITPQIDHFGKSRFWRELTPQFLMVEGVAPCRE